MWKKCKEIPVKIDWTLYRHSNIVCTKRFEVLSLLGEIEVMEEQDSWVSLDLVKTHNASHIKLVIPYQRDKNIVRN